MTDTRTPDAVTESAAANMWHGILSVLPAIDAARVTVGYNTSTADLHRGTATVYDDGRPVTEAARSAAFAAAVRNGYAAQLDYRDPLGRQYLALTVNGRHALAETPR